MGWSGRLEVCIDHERNIRKIIRKYYFLCCKYGRHGDRWPEHLYNKITEKMAEEENPMREYIDSVDWIQKWRRTMDQINNGGYYSDEDDCEDSTCGRPEEDG